MKTFIYFDSPYLKKGYNLYINYFDVKDHKDLSICIQKYLKEYNWVVSYDLSETIKNLYNKRDIEYLHIGYSAGNKKSEKEIIVYSDRLSH